MGDIDILKERIDEVGTITDLLKWIIPGEQFRVRHAVSADKSYGWLGAAFLAEWSASRSLETAEQMLIDGWSGSGQSLTLRLAASMMASLESDESAEVADLVSVFLVNAPGFEEHCSLVKQICAK